ncbi:MULTISPECIES: pitrilysin family protein [unclassified Streptomyces]|uniref:M16 family metallopeptidase n=1 Tax=unclassified Streptomyces TaxID=2593676 RepID=UPI001BEC0E42|nr:MULTISPECIES: insulinase family protein [unclassified Streptomyces]MBT2402416.1 insulinase family protein [Streptomyces sp. ISL-21]MBT2611536.1 insulinase family protein [Streptomyces sp. ISL-87]
MNTDATMTTDADGIVTTTVDGIRTVLAPRSGLLTAGLLFRVGRADETLATSGITHLVEHLALHRHGLSDRHCSGAAYTHFRVTGTAADVVEYLNGVCAALRDLPVDRLATEKEILRTEAAGRGRAPSHAATQWRYGSRSYGLAGYAEAGLPGITEEDVRDWARTRFTAENAVLWITGDTVPEGLDLTLPTGRRHPAPGATPVLPVTPAYFHGDGGGVVLTSVLPRSAAASLFTGVLRKELFRQLRQEGGYSSTATAEYHPRDAGSATVVAYADSLPQKQDALVGAFLGVLAGLRAGRIEQSALDAVRATALAALDTPEVASARLPDHAVNLLLGRRNLTAAEARTELEAVTAEALREVAHAVWADALVQLPSREVDVDVHCAGLTAAPTGSPDLVTGRPYPAVADPGVTLHIADDGVSMVSPHQRVTVRYAECSLMQAYPDGARHLVGDDGFTVTVEPALYRIPPAELALVDAAVPPSAVVAMPPRAPSRIPRPAAPAPAAPPAERSVWFTVLLWVLGVPGLIIGGSVLVLGLALGDRHDHIPEDEAQYLLTWLFLAGVLLIPWAICLDRRIKGKN